MPPGLFCFHYLKTFLVRRVSHRGSLRKIWFRLTLVELQVFNALVCLVQTFKSPSAYRGARLFLEARNGGCCLTKGYLKLLPGLRYREGLCRIKVSLPPLLGPHRCIRLVSPFLVSWPVSFFLSVYLPFYLIH